LHSFADFMERYKRFAEVFEKTIGKGACWKDCKRCREINLRNACAAVA
jgi:hypothetical protein